MGHALRVTVVADAAAAVGRGHLARCTAVASALGERGAEVRCLGFEADEPSELDGVSWEPVYEPVTADGLLVLDSYSARRDEFAPDAVFLDQGEPPAGTKLVIGPSGLAPPDYACLRRPYWTPPRREAAADVQHVLVSTGAATPAATLAGEVAAALPNAHVKVTGEEDAVGVEAIGTPPTLRDELEACDLAVTGAGQSMLEALATGRPVVAVITADNQRAQARSVEDVVLLAEGDVWTKVAELAADRKRRLDLARRAREAVDGRGAHRVADALLGLLE